jgi:hypothetical protein
VKSARDPVCVVEDLEDGREAVDRRRSVRDDPMPAIESGLVDSNHDRGVGRLERRSARDDASRARGEMRFEFRASPAARRRLEHRLDTELPPGRRLRLVLAGDQSDLPPGGVEMPFPDRHLGGKAAEQRVELQEVLERFGIIPVADGGDADVLSLVEQTEEVPSDPAEPQNSDDRHDVESIAFRNRCQTSR